MADVPLAAKAAVSAAAVAVRVGGALPSAGGAFWKRSGAWAAGGLLLFGCFLFFTTSQSEGMLPMTFLS